MGRMKDVLIDFESSVEEIYRHRNDGNYSEAIQVCLERLNHVEIKDFRFFYHKELGELYSITEDYLKSSQAYLDAFNNIADRDSNFRTFARSVDRFLKRNFPETYFDSFREALIGQLKFSAVSIAYQTSLLIDYELPLHEFLSPLGSKLNRLIFNDNDFDKMVPILKKMESENYDEEIQIILDIQVLNRSRTKKTLRLDKYFITVYERYEEYHKAQKIAIELVILSQESVIVRSLFRLCRKLDDYDPVNDVLLKFPYLEKENDFNILYELVYYYDKINNTLAKKNALSKIEKTYFASRPILKTLKNLYLRFGSLDDIRRIEALISRLPDNRSFGEKKELVEESEESVWSALEYSKRLDALSNLTKGISHELGQPLTNIRFMVQYYTKNLSKLDNQTLIGLFGDILVETERMGDLINRLSPITTARNTAVEYNVIERIRQRIKTEQTRLFSENINVLILSKSDIFVQGDPTIFDQVISNLLINSIQSLQNVRHKKKQISILLKEHKSKVGISFRDNGVGISTEIRRKIFEPFFTTKPEGQGQGLGLFVIWNLLKYQGGNIFLDYTFTNGAQFIVEIPKEAVKNE